MRKSYKLIFCFNLFFLSSVFYSTGSVARVIFKGTSVDYHVFYATDIEAHKACQRLAEQELLAPVSRCPMKWSFEDNERVYLYRVPHRESNDTLRFTNIFAHVLECSKGDKLHPYEGCISDAAYSKKVLHK